jgi:hypothetical protein
MWQPLLAAVWIAVGLVVIVTDFAVIGMAPSVRPATS